jgi:hypothetical protein
MSYLDNRRRLKMLGMALKTREGLLKEELQYLSAALIRIAQGEDANHVFGVKLQKGCKDKDVLARKRMSFILSFVQSYMYPNPDSNEQEMVLEDACVKAAEEIVPLARRLYPGDDQATYNSDYIQRCHSSPEYSHMRKPERTWLDDDFPYQS